MGLSSAHRKPTSPTPQSTPAAGFGAALGHLQGAKVLVAKTLEIGKDTGEAIAEKALQPKTQPELP